MIETEWRPPDGVEEERLGGVVGRGGAGGGGVGAGLRAGPVAVKFGQAEAPVARARLFDEARAIARLQHPNVVAIYRVAEVAGHPYLVSESLGGRPLTQLAR